jgi:DNA-binding IclR family transcriptional regulator
VSARLTDEQRVILDALRDREPAGTAQAIARTVGLPVGRVGRILKELRAEGAARRLSRSHGFRWVEVDPELPRDEP